MRNRRPSLTTLTGLLCSLAFPAAVMAQAGGEDAIGIVITVTGQVEAQDASGAVRPLRRGAEVFSAETIAVGPEAYAQIRMVDEAIISLKSDTSFTISSYEFDGNPATPDTATMSMIRGGFRTISGSIGDADEDTYRIDTQYASIGIRGTMHSAVIVDGVLFTGVYDGGTTISNNQGSIDAGIGADFDYTETFLGDAPRGLVEAPSVLGLVNFTPVLTGDTADTAAADGVESNTQNDEAEPPRFDALANDDAAPNGTVAGNTFAALSANSEPADTLADTTANITGGDPQDDVNPLQNSRRATELDASAGIGNGNSGGDNGNSGNGNAGGNNGNSDNGNAGGNNSGNSGNGNSGGNNSGNSGNGSSGGNNSGNSGNGSSGGNNSGSSGNGNSGDNNSGNSGNGNSGGNNSGNSGNGNSGGNNSGNSGNGNSGGNNSGNSGNGNSGGNNSGNSGNGNSGGNNSGSSGNGNSGGNTSGSTGNGNSGGTNSGSGGNGNAGGNNGNSGNSGSGNGDNTRPIASRALGIERVQQLPLPGDAFVLSWGIWDSAAPLAQNGIRRTISLFFDTDAEQASLVPANMASLSGTVNYASSGEFAGTDATGAALSDVHMTFDVNLAGGPGAITNGSLVVLDSHRQTWNAIFDGNLTSASAVMTNVAGTYAEKPLSGSIQGVFTGTGSRPDFVSGFVLQSDGAFVHGITELTSD